MYISLNQYFISYNLTDVNSSLDISKYVDLVFIFDVPPELKEFIVVAEADITVVAA